MAYCGRQEMGETMIPLIVCFLLLSLIFWTGAHDSLSQPRVTEREAEAIVTDAVYTAAKAVVVGIGLLVLGLAFI